MYLPRFAIFLLLFGSNAAVYRSQEPCRPPEIVFNRNSSNLFTEQQEMFLGDAVSEYVGSRYRVISDEEANRYVRTIGERLTKHLPPTTIKFRFMSWIFPNLMRFPPRAVEST